MERKIGEIFECNGEWYQCLKGLGCNECDLSKLTCYHRFKSGSCSPNMRKDKTQVIFKKLEKIEESYEFDGHLFQSYRTFEVPIFTENYATIREFGNNSKISIEIKQNKEDMEEKKIQHYDCFFDKEQSKPNLKPFSLELAKQGKPVCTRNGIKARIICFDLKGAEYPIVAAVETHDCLAESISAYDKNGKFDHDKETNNDLMMLPEKKEGWVNVYRDCDGANITKDDNIYSSKDAAIASAKIIDRDNYVATTIIKWEE